MGGEEQADITKLVNKLQRETTKYPEDGAVAAVHGVHPPFE